MKTLLVFQTAYTYSEMKRDSLEIYFTSKDLSGYFSKVITVNPIASYTFSIGKQESKFGKTKIYMHNKTHIFIEGSHARYRFVQKFPKLNFFFAQLHLVFQIFKICLKNRVDFVRAENPTFCGIWGYLFAKILRKPLLVGVWGNPDTNRKLLSGPMSPKIFQSVNVEKTIEKFILSRADRALAQNFDNLQFILNLGVPESRTAIFKLGNGIHPSHFATPASRTLENTWFKELQLSHSKLVLSVGALERRKIYEDALEVIRILKGKFDLKYLIVGEGSQREHYEHLVIKLGISDNVIFLGKMKQTEIAALFSKVDLVLSPLTGRALTEALLGSAPVVAYDIDCHPELITSGETGELVEYRNYHEMAIKSSRILADPEYAEFLGTNARKFALEFMDPDKIIREQRSVYEALL